MRVACSPWRLQNDESTGCANSMEIRLLLEVQASICANACHRRSSRGEVDYGLYPELGDRAMGFLTRGCPHRCPFCLVPKKEGNVRLASDLDGLLQGRKKLILLNDNILAHPRVGDLLEQMVRHPRGSSFFTSRWMNSSISYLRSTSTKI